MFEDILINNYMGGLVFTWQDEWFKRTWNTMDFDNPDRRPFWSNAQTSEQQFGLLSFDRLKIHVDGALEDWQEDPLYSDLSAGPLDKVYVDHDERYLYLRVDLKEASKESRPLLFWDTIPNQGNKQFQEVPDLAFHNGADFLVDLNPDQSQVLVDHYYNVHSYLYEYVWTGATPYSYSTKKNSGQFDPIHYVLNKEIYNPETGQEYAFEDYPTGNLTRGNSDPNAPDYKSLADYRWSKDGKSVEVRLPWLLLSFRDPSQREVMDDFLTTQDVHQGTFIDGIGIGIAYVDEDQELVAQYPKQDAPFKTYTWETWDQPLSQPRLKKSYDVLQKYFETIH